MFQAYRFLGVQTGMIKNQGRKVAHLYKSWQTASQIMVQGKSVPVFDIISCNFQKKESDFCQSILMLTRSTGVPVQKMNLTNTAGRISRKGNYG